ncbi:hypothetical protein HMPREF6485_2185 [Segatella buccae ATCC 33574]|uniref:Uncharacterized protein n=1 Tax=Segatella buccae ATCC 33574 TaxID=873513 RepID=E6K999_9BACT|nr:hypothetical protein HMPREF6485_2185 [Segatella buccae ATCC 33574]
MAGLHAREQQSGSIGVAIQYGGLQGECSILQAEEPTAVGQQERMGFGEVVPVVEETLVVVAHRAIIRMEHHEPVVAYNPNAPFMLGH